MKLFSLGWLLMALVSACAQAEDPASADEQEVARAHFQASILRDQRAAPVKSIDSDDAADLAAETNRSREPEPQLRCAEYGECGGCCHYVEGRGSYCCGCCGTTCSCHY